MNFHKSIEFLATYERVIKETSFNEEPVGDDFIYLFCDSKLS